VIGLQTYAMIIYSSERRNKINRRTRMSTTTSTSIITSALPAVHIARMSAIRACILFKWRASDAVCRGVARPAVASTMALVCGRVRRVGRVCIVELVFSHCNKCCCCCCCYCYPWILPLRPFDSFVVHRCESCRRGSSIGGVAVSF
jgi:hypothetical protein